MSTHPGVTVGSSCAGFAPAFSAALPTADAAIAHSRFDAFAAEFESPSNAFRGKPFWSWNGDLREEELIRQVHVFKEMGFGGFFMHSRTGLVTDYLGDEWFRLTNVCADEAEKLGMEAWLYDEDRWPSGTAGGMVTEDPKHRAKFIRLRTIPSPDFKWNDWPEQQVLAVFSCRLDGLAYADAKRLSHNDLIDVGATVLVFVVEEMAPSSFYNGYTYVDTLSRAATNRFIELTHDKYKARCGDRLGRSIKGIFTDEPHRGPVMSGFGASNADGAWLTPWTEAMAAEFQNRFGYDLIERLPELFLRPDGQAVSQVKWHYVELLQQLFLENFAKPIHAWCGENNLFLTGHVLHEDDLTSQVSTHGSLMRFYEYMHNPGVDVLTEDNRNYWVVKQLTSVARQLGQTWLLSELYGCTGWQMNFEGHKAVGDWQALFGINVRCHHLSWYTMEGEAKRDYPASISYQSAWWKDYKHVETYFARLGLILKQGRPVCDVLVISSVESVWCQIHAGWATGMSPNTEAVIELEKAHHDLFHWLAGEQIDFDYGDEEMLGRMHRIGRDGAGRPALFVGETSYRVVIVGKMTTIRATTVRMLEEFRGAGGEVIVAGEAPRYVDALLSPAADSLARQATQAPWDKSSFIKAVASAVGHGVSIVDRADGTPLEKIFCQLRNDGDRSYLVAVNVDSAAGFEAVVRVPADRPYSARVTEWDCLTGERRPIPAKTAGLAIEIEVEFPPGGSHAYVIEESGGHNGVAPKAHVRVSSEQCDGPFAYALAERNVCVLDFAKYQVDGGDWRPPTEILKVDRAIRSAFCLPLRGGEMIQPWFRRRTRTAPRTKGRVKLAFNFNIQDKPTAPMELCIERPGHFDIRLNGNALSSESVVGWWIDPAFEILPLPTALLVAGENELVLDVAFDEGMNLEALYLTGDFGVRINGIERTIVSAPATLAVGDVACQGLPFYGGSIVYRIPVMARPGAGQRAILELPKFEAACAKVGRSNRADRLIAWQPYRADITRELAQSGMIELDVVLTRRNTFGPLHQLPLKDRGYGPVNFVTEGASFSRDYMLYPAGLLAAPRVLLEQLA